MHVRLSNDASIRYVGDQEYFRRSDLIDIDRFQDTFNSRNVKAPRLTSR